MKPLPDAVQSWKAQYDPPRAARERYQLLVLFGPSCTGKSRLAKSLFGHEHTLVIDVQHAKHPDLRSYRRHKHRAILFDELSSPDFVVDNKKLLQAHVDGAILGQSSTQLFTYEVFLWRTPIILTTNNWDISAMSRADRNWIETNCVAVHIENRVWVSGGQASETGTPPASEVGSERQRVWHSPQSQHDQKRKR